MNKRQRAATIVKIEAKIESIKQVIEMAEKWWSEHGAEDHPIFNNDLYDALHSTEAELKAVKTGTLSTWEAKLVSENID